MRVSLSSSSGQGLRVGYREPPLARLLNETLVFQSGELTADGLICEPQKICDLVAFQVQIKSGRLCRSIVVGLGVVGSHGEHEQKACYPLLRCFTSEQDHPVPGGIKIIQCLFQESLFQIWKVFHHLFERADRVGRGGGVGAGRGECRPHGTGDLAAAGRRELAPLLFVLLLSLLLLVFVFFF